MLKRYYLIGLLLIFAIVACNDGEYRDKIISRIFENPHKLAYYIERYPKYTAPFKDRYFTSEEKKSAVTEPIRKAIEEYFTPDYKKVCEKEVEKYTSHYGMKNNFIIEYYSGANPDLFIRVDWIRNLSNYQLADIQIVSVVVCDSLSNN